jgi:hypothetical protein
MTLLGNSDCGICAGRLHPPSPLPKAQRGGGIVAGAARASEAAQRLGLGPPRASSLRSVAGVRGGAGVIEATTRDPSSR